MPARHTPSRGGKPDKLMRDALIIALRRAAQDANGKPTRRLQLVADALVRAAEAGEVSAIREIFDRVDGKAAQPLEHAFSESLEERLARIAKT